MRGGDLMRWNCRKSGTLAILLGIGVLLVVILPATLWPFLIGLTLIVVGVCMMRR